MDLFVSDTQWNLLLSAIFGNTRSARRLVFNASPHTSRDFDEGLWSALLKNMNFEIVTCRSVPEYLANVKRISRQISDAEQVYTYPSQSILTTHLIANCGAKLIEEGMSAYFFDKKAIGISKKLVTKVLGMALFGRRNKRNLQLDPRRVDFAFFPDRTGLRDRVPTRLEVNRDVWGQIKETASASLQGPKGRILFLDTVVRRLNRLDLSKVLSGLDLGSVVVKPHPLTHKQNWHRPSPELGALPAIPPSFPGELYAEQFEEIYTFPSTSAYTMRVLYPDKPIQVVASHSQSSDLYLPAETQAFFESLNIEVIRF